MNIKPVPDVFGRSRFGKGDCEAERNLLVAFSRNCRLAVKAIGACRSHCSDRFGDQPATLAMKALDETVAVS